MTDAPSIDLFKFVAVRAIEMGSARDVAVTTIEDGRAGTQDGATRLKVLSRELHSVGTALERWNALDRVKARTLAEHHRPLSSAVRALTGSAPVPGDLPELAAARTALGNANVSLLWDALYVAERTGPDAGHRLDAPIAALRVAHACALLRKEPTTTAYDFRRALAAVPVLPRAFTDPIEAPTPRPPVTDAPGRNKLVTDARAARLRALREELMTAQMMLASLLMPGRKPMARVSTDVTHSDGEGVAGRFTLTNARPLAEVFGTRLSVEGARVMDRLRIGHDTSIAGAAEALEAHVVRLQDEVAALGGTSMQTMSGTPGSRTTFSDAFTGVGGAAGVFDDDLGDLIEQMSPGSADEVNVQGSIRPLGIGDLKVVKQTLLGYYDGEVAHIENVLRGERKERSHRNLDRNETTVFTADGQTSETERNTQSTDRFEVKRETEETLKEDLAIKAGLTVTASFGPVVTTATGDFAYSTSRQQSEKSSANFARDVVDRSVTKVQTKTRAERTTKTFSEVEEINKHGLDNTTPGTEHIVGVYRWVDKRYRAQVYNYGRRLLLEFVVPEPAAFFRAAQKRDRLAERGLAPPPPLEFSSGVPLTPDLLTPGNYRKFVGLYRVTGVSPAPALFAMAGTAVSKEGIELGKSTALANKEFTVPEGYQLNYYSATVSALWKNGGKLALQVGRDLYPLLNQPFPGALMLSALQPGAYDEVTVFTGSIPVSVATYDVLAYAVNVQGVCVRTDAKLLEWKHQTYDKIATAYQALKTAFDQKATQANVGEGIRIAGRNPGANRTIERTELQKLCITMMTGQHFSMFSAMTDPPNQPRKHPEVQVLQALEEGRIVQFFEQAFEWEQMTYLFFPYFWGRKANWVGVSQLEDTDPLFERFLTAGAARVVVPVPLQYVDAVLYLLESNKSLADRVWLGGDRPTLDSDLYKSLAAELREQTDDLQGAKPEGEPWEYTVPTTLVHLQADGTLPVFV